MKRIFYTFIILLCTCKAGFTQNPCLEYLQATTTTIHIAKNQWSVLDQKSFTDQIDSYFRSSTNNFGANAILPVEGGAPIPVGLKSDKSLTEESKTELINSVSNYFASSDKSVYDFVLPSPATLEDYTKCLIAHPIVANLRNYYTSKIEEQGDELKFIIHPSADIRKTKFSIFLTGGKLISPTSTNFDLEGTNTQQLILIKKDTNTNLNLTIVTDKTDEMISIFRPVSRPQILGKWAVMIGTREYDLGDAEQLAVHDNRTIDPHIFLLRTNTVRHGENTEPDNYFRFFIHDPQHQSYEDAKKLYDRLYPLYKDDPNKFPQIVDLESYLPKGKTYGDYRFNGSHNYIRMCDWRD